MPVSFVKGDILDEATKAEGPRALAFAADCAGTMDAGIAVAIRQRWPELAEAFRAHAAGGKMQLVDFFTWEHGDLSVYALGIQKGGAKPRVSSVARALRAAIDRAVEAGIPRVLLPRVGGGKTGLDWSRVKRVVVEVVGETPIDVVVFEQFVRADEPA